MYFYEIKDDTFETNIVLVPRLFWARVYVHLSIRLEIKWTIHFEKTFLSFKLEFVVQTIPCYKITKVSTFGY